MLSDRPCPGSPFPQWVTAAQMRAIEGALFDQGMPVAALMERAIQGLTECLVHHYPRERFPRVGVWVGPGHNGGDALGVARELHLRGYGVLCHCPFDHLKDLTAQHWHYAQWLGVASTPMVAALCQMDLILDGGFGFGLTRPLTGAIAAMVEVLNQSGLPIVSIDLPSGIHTDTGEVLGTAIRADRTLCLGLWKRAFVQDAALPYLGETTLIPIGIPPQALPADLPDCRWWQTAEAIAHLPLRRDLLSHKYRQGHLLLIAGCQRYSGAAILATLGARGAGVGMVTVAVPRSLQGLLQSQAPEALVLPCGETTTGEIEQLPEDLDFSRYQAIALGPGLGPGRGQLWRRVVSRFPEDRPLLVDADGLNQLAAIPDWWRWSQGRSLVITPHAGEFQRLFPDLGSGDRVTQVQRAGDRFGGVLLLKGARTLIAAGGAIRAIANGSPALARGGSGDVLTGLLGGLLAQTSGALLSTVASGAWWHGETARRIAQDRTLLGCDPLTLAQRLIPTLGALQPQPPKFPRDKKS